MEEILLTCPHCGFYREIAPAKIPPGVKNAVCPECKRRFSLAEALDKPGRLISGNSGDDWHYWGKLAGHRSLDDERQVAAPCGQPAGEGLLQEGWRVYRGKAASLSLLYLYTLLLTLLPWLGYWQFRAGTFPAFGRWHESLLILLLFALASACGLVLGWGALLRGVVDDDTGVGSSIRGGFRNFSGNVQLGCWLLFLVAGGAFWLLLPAVIFAVYVSLACFVYVHERERGLDAICISRQYVRGAFWGTVGKLVLLALLLLLGSLLVITQIVVLPFVLVCLGLLYRDLRQKSQGTRSLADRKFRLRFVGPVVATYLCLFLFLTLIAGREVRTGGDSFAAQMTGLKQQARSLLLDSWRLSGLSTPGCGLVLSKRTFDPGERMEVRLALSSKIAQNYYVCVARDGEGCYESLSLDQEAQAQRLFMVDAPKQRGTYHLKVFSDYDREVAITSLEFQVI